MAFPELRCHSATVYASKTPQAEIGMSDLTIATTFRSWDEARKYYLELYAAKEEQGLKFIALELSPDGLLASKDSIFDVPHGHTRHIKVGPFIVCHWTCHDKTVSPYKIVSFV